MCNAVLMPGYGPAKARLLHEDRVVERHEIRAIDRLRRRQQLGVPVEAEAGRHRLAHRVHQEHDMLRRVGVREVHMRISSPPIINSCFYGIDTPTRKELIASKFSIEKIKNYLGVNSLAYLSEQGMLASTRMNTGDFCTACFTGKYPIQVEKELIKS